MKISLLGSYDDKCKLTETATYSDQENISFSYGSSCNNILATESLGPAYIEDSCNNKKLCLYKDISSYDLCKPVEADESHAFQVDNNNFNITYSGEVDSQYASCSNHNISMISSACYSNSTVGYSNVSYNAVYPIKDVNKNYGEVRISLELKLKLNCNVTGMHGVWRGCTRRLAWVRSLHVHQTSSTIVGNSKESSRSAHSHTKHARNANTSTRLRRNAGSLQSSGAERRKLQLSSVFSSKKALTFKL